MEWLFKIIDNIGDKINEISENIKTFMIDNQWNPIVGGIIFLVLLGIFMWAYSKLNKD